MIDNVQGERRIRVHTLCIPTTASLQEVIQSADQQCIVGLLAKMAVDRTLNTNLADAREAFINVCVDTIERWKMLQCINQPGVLPCSASLRLLPLLILSLLKSPAFTTRRAPTTLMRVCCANRCPPNRNRCIDRVTVVYPKHFFKFNS